MFKKYRKGHAADSCFIPRSYTGLTRAVALVRDIVRTIDVSVTFLLQRYTLSVIALPGISGTCFFRWHKVNQAAENMDC